MIYMLEVNVKKYVFLPFLLSQLNILLIFNISNKELEINLYSYSISSLIYSMLFLIIIDAYTFNKIVGVILFLSTTFLAPLFGSNLAGELFPITIEVFFIYFLFRLGLKIFKYWKKTMEL